jgi:hypothetical protein
LSGLGLQIIAADLDLDRRFERGTLFNLFDEAKRVFDFAVEHFAQMDDERGHIFCMAGIHEHLRDVRGRLSRQDVVIKHRRAAAADDDGALDGVLFLQEPRSREW